MLSAAALFFILLLAAATLLVAAYGVVLFRSGRRTTHPGEQPAWPRYHVRFYVFALILIAFDMEMAYMYPWAVVFKSLGWIAFAEIGFFLTVLGMGILYAWREGALEWS
ncbi:MAG TPA: NADH-quinone oxidoreductase subunit A [Thermoleophilaceae bacterium]|nr:NADH-quinone oxidoreductase subunit A [Thermoleophilaceae bacterium]